VSGRPAREGRERLSERTLGGPNDAENLQFVEFAQDLGQPVAARGVFLDFLPRSGACFGHVRRIRTCAFKVPSSKEQGVTFAVVIVKEHVLKSSQDVNQAIRSFAPMFGGLPVVLMAQDYRGVAHLLRPSGH